ncbi:MAG: HPP family protein [Gemmatimonadales bacterium]|nr:HPP family protein [Gemmatimonadales bacterium]
MLSPALTVALVTALMALFDCVHPPGVGIAASYITDSGFHDLGYKYVGSSMLGLATLLFVSMTLGNFSRFYTFPAFWL